MLSKFAEFLPKQRLGKTFPLSTACMNISSTSTSAIKLSKVVISSSSTSTSLIIDEQHQYGWQCRGLSESLLPAKYLCKVDTAPISACPPQTTITNSPKRAKTRGKPAANHQYRLFDAQQW
jgi:hypothetical protein